MSRMVPSHFQMAGGCRRDPVAGLLFERRRPGDGSFSPDVLGDEMDMLPEVR